MNTARPKTIKALNKFIAKEIRSTIQINKGEGYFYLCSDDKTESLLLASLYQTGVYVNNISDLTFDSWYESILTLLTANKVI